MKRQVWGPVIPLIVVAASPGVLWASLSSRRTEICVRTAPVARMPPALLGSYERPDYASTQPAIR